MSDQANYKVKTLSPLRKIIAARMTEAKQSIPHFRLQSRINMEALMAARQSHNKTGCAAKISVNDLLIKASANALMQVPEINCQYLDGEMHLYPNADIAVVIAVDGGLSTPIVKAANTKSLQQIAAEVKDCSTRAAEGRIKIDEISGGSFSISNLGMFGVDQFDAIINPPQCAILALGATQAVAVVQEERITKALCMTATLSLDHRVLDGISGARFLSALKVALENPEGLFKEAV